MSHLLVLRDDRSLQLLVSFRLMNDLVFHELVELAWSHAICCRLSLLCLAFPLIPDDLFVFQLLLDSLLVFVPDLLCYPLLRVKHEPVDALGYLLLNAELLLPPLHKSEHK